MEMRRSPRCDVSNEEWWSLAALRVRSVVQRWRNRHAADRADASRACRGGKDSINEARGAMRLECVIREDQVPVDLVRAHGEGRKVTDRMVADAMRSLPRLRTVQRA